MLSGVLVLGGAVAAPGASAAAQAAELDGFVARLAREHQGWLTAGPVPGAAIALIRDGRMAWAGGYGRLIRAGSPAGSARRAGRGIGHLPSHPQA